MMTSLQRRLFDAIEPLEHADCTDLYRRIGGPEDEAITCQVVVANLTQMAEAKHIVHIRGRRGSWHLTDREACQRLGMGITSALADDLMPGDTLHFVHACETRSAKFQRHGFGLLMVDNPRSILGMGREVGIDRDCVIAIEHTSELRKEEAAA